MLEDRASIWSARPDRRYLPTLSEWALAGLATRWWAWAEGERRMMAAATRYYAVRLVLGFLLAAAAYQGGLAIVGRWEREKRAHEVSALVSNLLVSEIDHVRAAVDRLEPYWPAWREVLTQAAIDPGRSIGARTRAHLALVRHDGSSVAFLVDRLFVADPAEHRVIREALAPRRREASRGLWQEFAKPIPNRSRLVRAAAGLARLSSETPRWDEVADLVTRGLVAEPFSFVPAWIDALRPVGSRLAYALDAVYEDTKRPSSERANAAVALRTLEGDEPGLRLLTELLKDENEPGEFRALLSRLVSDGDGILPAFRSEVFSTPDLEPDARSDDRDRLARRKANSAIAVLRVGDCAEIWPLLDSTADPNVRDLLIHRMVASGIEPGVLLARLEVEPEPGVRQAILLALGEPSSGVEAEMRDEWLKTVEGVFVDDPHSGVHSAAEWLLRRWSEGVQVAKIRNAHRGLARDGWSINSQSLTMIHVRGPVSFQMGSPDSLPSRIRQEDEPAHLVRIDRSFAISAHEVTVEQFLRYKSSFQFDRNVCTEDDGPMTKVSWYEAVAYCRWLSQKDGITDVQMCYPSLTEIAEAAETNADIDCRLDRPGYRLPTEAEWEYSARAGSTTLYFFGESASRLKDYGWFSDNADFQVWPGGLLKPNALGLFDVYGNAREWCQDAYSAGSNAASGSPPSGTLRVARGGSYRTPPLLCRSASREGYPPKTRFSLYGLRVVRTLPDGAAPTGR
jgi:formylglycine-generating enzyme required for sulfatase activity